MKKFSTCFLQFFFPKLMSFFLVISSREWDQKSCDILGSFFANLEKLDLHHGIHRGVICCRRTALLHQSQVVAYLDC